MVTFNKIKSGLIGWGFEMPNAPYSKRCRALKKNEKTIKKHKKNKFANYSNRFV